MAIGSPVTLSQLQGLARPAARIKVLPEDWRVTEELERSFADSGEHYYLYVRKRCLSTIPVANRLAKAFDVPAMDVGFAGMKDKHAVTEQWFSVRQPTNDKYNIVTKTLFLTPELMSGFNSLWLFPVSHPLGENNSDWNQRRWHGFKQAWPKTEAKN